MMSTTVHQKRRANPYKGVDSFQAEDAPIFFGRDREAQQIVAKILSSRLCVIHAPSGAGKTSILNARIIPELEARGWTPVRALLQDNPIRAIRYATVLSAMPPPALESESIKRLITNVPSVTPEISLEVAISLFEKLSVRDTRHADVTSAVATDIPMWKGERGLSRPFFCRLLQGSVTVERYCEHIRALVGGDAGQINPTTPLATIIEVLSCAEAQKVYAKLINDLDIPTPDLLSFFQHLFNSWGYPKHVKYGIVLIIDQFEELFTRFVDFGKLPAGGKRLQPDWRLRTQFLDELRRLYLFGQWGEDNRSSDPVVDRSRDAEGLRIRCVISIRNEFIASLDELRTAEASTISLVHLDFLGLQDAAEAINEPAASYGYSYSAKCFEEINRDLVREGRYIEPSHIQIICDRLWNRFGSHLQKTPRKDNDLAVQITGEMLGELGGALGILSSYFDEFLHSFSAVEQFSILEMLEPLITSRGTRNIVEKTQLTRLPFRDVEVAEDLLAKIEASRIVRVEPRLGGSFVEITHEFLISSILAAIRLYLITDAEASSFREAIRALQRLLEAGVGRGDDANLPERDFRQLHKRRRYISWMETTAEVMLRAAIVNGTKSRVMKYWALRFARLTEDVSIGSLIDEISRGSWRGLVLGMPEVKAIVEEVSVCSLNEKARINVLIGALRRGQTSDRDIIGRIASQLEMCDEANAERHFE
jgi:hypothetical protein